MDSWHTSTATPRRTPTPPHSGLAMLTLALLSIPLLVAACIIVPASIHAYVRMRAPRYARKGNN